MKKSNVTSNSNRSTKSIQTLGNVLLCPYHHSGFKAYCERNPGTFVLDARLSGKSSDPQFDTRALSETIGEERYKLLPDLAPKPGDTEESFVKHLALPVARIGRALELGVSVIVTGYNSSLLKVIGHYIMKTKPEARAWLAWEIDGKTGASRQRPMDAEELTARVKKLLEPCQEFSATTPINSVSIESIFG